MVDKLELFLDKYGFNYGFVETSEFNRYSATSDDTTPPTGTTGAIIGGTGAIEKDWVSETSLKIVAYMNSENKIIQIAWRIVGTGP
jgi:hypothetical protein